MATTVKLDYKILFTGKMLECLENKCLNCNVLRLSTDYRKNCKIVSPESLAVYTVKFEHGGFSMQQDAEGMANSVDSDCSA